MTRMLWPTASAARSTFPAALEAPILLPQIGLGVRRGMGRLHQRRFDVAIAGTGASTVPLARTLFMPWAHPSPGGQVPGIGKAREIGAHLGTQDMRGVPAHAGDLLQADQQVLHGL